MRPTRKLTDSRCQCSGCGEYFNSDTAFEKHRIGQFGVNRRCMTPAEMLAAGMSRNAADWWISESAETRTVPFPDRGARLERIEGD
jgi:hypothetical protein